MDLQRSPVSIAHEMAQKIIMDDAVGTLLEGSLCSFLTGRLKEGIGFIICAAGC